MNNQKQIIEDIATYHNEEGRIKNYNWIRTCVTILTPSLALLVGLQGNDLQFQCLVRIFLQVSIALMTISILLGLLALRSESKSHVSSRNEVIRLHNEGKDLPQILETRIKLAWYYRFSLYIFPYVFWLSILALGIFGCFKAAA